MRRIPILIVLVAMVLLTMIGVGVHALTHPTGSDRPAATPTSADPQHQDRQAVPSVHATPRTSTDDAPAAFRIVRVDLDGRDLAEAMRIPIWRFDYDLPADDYAVRLWAERWTRTADEPEIHPLIDRTVLTGSDRLLLRLPTDHAPDGFARVGPLNASLADAPGLRPQHPYRLDALDERDIDLDRPIHLLTFTHNTADTPVGGLEDVHRDHEFTIYIKIEFRRPGDQTSDVGP